MLSRLLVSVEVFPLDLAHLMVEACSSLSPSKCFNALSDSSVSEVFRSPCSRSSDNTLKPCLEPLDRVIFLDLMFASYWLIASSSPSHSHTRSGHAAVEVHTVDANRRIVLDAQIDVLRDTKSEVASVREVLLAKLVLLDLQTTLEDFLSLRASNGDVYGNLFVSSDTKGTDGVASFAYEFDSVLMPLRIKSECEMGKFHTVDGSLTTQLLKHFGSTSETITRFANRNIENELVDAQLTHRIRALVFAFRHLVVELTIETELFMCRAA